MPTDHERLVGYRVALRQAHDVAAEQELVLRLAGEPDALVRGDVLKDLVDRAAARSGGLEEFDAWIRVLAGAGPELEFVRRRVAEWRLLLRADAGDAGALHDVLDGSAWLQHRATSFTHSAELLRALAEQGSTRRIRAAAARRRG